MNNRKTEKSGEILLIDAVNGHTGQEDFKSTGV